MLSLYIPTYGRDIIAKNDVRTVLYERSSDNTAIFVDNSDEEETWDMETLRQTLACEAES